MAEVNSESLQESLDSIQLNHLVADTKPATTTTTTTPAVATTAPNAPPAASAPTGCLIMQPGLMCSVIENNPKFDFGEHSASLLTQAVLALLLLLKKTL